MDTEFDTLQAEVERVRGCYHEEREFLTRLVGTHYADPESVTLAMFAKADEHGPSIAAEQLLADPNHYGTLKDTTTDDFFAFQYDHIEKQLEKVLDLHDELDVATGKREGYLCEADPSRLMVLHFQGEEFEVDYLRREARSLADPDKVLELAVEGLDAEPHQMSVIERFARDNADARADPLPPRDRTRSR